MATDFRSPDATGSLANSPFYRVVNPSNDEIRLYSEQQYPAFLQSIRQYFESLPSLLLDLKSRLSVAATLVNSGYVPAEHLHFEGRTRGDITFWDADGPRRSLQWEKPAIPTLPSPPTPPQPRLEKTPLCGPSSLGSFFENSNLLRDQLMQATPVLSPAKRDPVAFYWEDRPNGTYCRPSCEDFRPEEEECLRLVICCLDIDIRRNAALEIAVSARNLPRVLRRTLPIAFEVYDADLLAEAKAQDVPDILLDVLTEVHA